MYLLRRPGKETSDGYRPWAQGFRWNPETVASRMKAQLPHHYHCLKMGIFLCTLQLQNLEAVTMISIWKDEYIRCQACLPLVSHSLLWFTSRHPTLDSDLVILKTVLPHMQHIRNFKLLLLTSSDFRMLIWDRSFSCFCVSYLTEIWKREC